MTEHLVTRWEPRYVAAVPPWAPDWLAWRGRDPLEGPLEREARARYAAGAGFRSAELILRAAAAQEPYRARQRALAHELERFRATHLVAEERAGPWGPQLIGFALEKLRSSPTVRGTTILNWIWSLVGILPEPIPARDLRQLREMVGHTWLLRPNATCLPREGGEAAQQAAHRAQSAGNHPLALALLLIARAGLRASDAVRIAAGQVEAFELLPGFLAVFPTTEKTDQIGARVVEPVVLPWPSPDAAQRWEATARRCLEPNAPTTAAEATVIRRAVTSALRAAGVKDARGPRRQLAETVARDQGRAMAARLLRHAAGSAVTARYTTTWDAVPPLLGALRRT